MEQSQSGSQEGLPLLVQLIHGTYQDKKTQEGKGLAHDSGQGAACTNCGTECSGFDLHFWRKVCKNCGCRPQAHEIQVNETVHKEIVKGLFNGGEERSKSMGSSSDEEPSVQLSGKDSLSRSGKVAPCIPEIRIESISLDDDFKDSKEKRKDGAGASPNRQQKATVSSYVTPQPKSVTTKVEKSALDKEKPSDKTVKAPKEQASASPGSNVSAPLAGRNRPAVSSKSEAAAPKDPEPIPAPPPRRESFVEVEKQRRLLNQLPPQDFDPKYCSTLNRKQKQAMNKMKDIKKQAAGKGKLSDKETNKQICVGCNSDITSGERGVSSTREKELVFWHEDCFKCHSCQEKIADFIYFWHEENIYCGRHFAEKFRPRCSACDELIYADQYTKAEGKAWHMEHFTCFMCDKNLADTNYISHKGQPHCMTCYHFKIASKCNSCALPIQVGEERVSYENRHWHAYPECFFCRGCNKNLVDVGFLLVDGKIYCSSKCSKKGPVF